MTETESKTKNINIADFSPDVISSTAERLILGEMVGVKKLIESAMQHLASNMSSVIDTE